MKRPDQYAFHIWAMEHGNRPDFIQGASEVIAEAMADARRAALEEAAKVADAFVAEIEERRMFANCDTYPFAKVARSIRALLDTSAMAGYRDAR